VIGAVLISYRTAPHKQPPVTLTSGSLSMAEAIARPFGVYRAAFQVKINGRRRSVSLLRIAAVQ